MFIQTEVTPNPATLKFLPGQDVLGQDVLGQGSAEFTDASKTDNSPLAKLLFAIDGVSSVFFGADFITITKTEVSDWTMIKASVLAAIMDHYSSGQPVLINTQILGDSPDQDPLITKIKELLDTRVRPSVAQDGGDITFDRFEDGIVYLQMKGSCSGCPSSTATLKHGIENMLKYYIPEIIAVEAA
jgi:Fe-S cluster biogenesis protein NfuA